MSKIIVYFLKFTAIFIILKRTKGEGWIKKIELREPKGKGRKGRGKIYYR